jgi:ferredoxin
MKIKIDQDGCIECGACEDTCSEVFVLESGEKASIVKKFQGKDGSEGEVSDDLSDCVESAAEDCPVDVIDIV